MTKNAKPFLSAEWRKLAIANYLVDPKIIAPHVPYKTEPDFFNGDCLVSLVAFRFVNTRLLGMHIPFHINFEEVNLRIYVRYKEGKQWKRGVTFIREIVPKHAIAFVANTIYKEKYIQLPTRHSIVAMNDKLQVKYGWKHQGAWDEFSVDAIDNPTEISTNSIEEFITEHYWGYSKRKTNITNEYEVIHPRWEMYPVESFNVTVRFEALYGDEFKVLDELKPHSVMLAEGSPVTVLPARRLP